MSITGDNKTGNFSSVYVSGNEQINGNLTVLGNITAGSSSTDIDFADGSAGAPSLSFTNDTLTGVYRDTTGGSGIGFTTNGTKRLKVSNTAVNSTVPIQINDGGTNTSPSLTFGTDTTSGLYRVAAGTTGISSFGTEVLSVNSSQLQSFVPIVTGSNSVSCGALQAASLKLPGSYIALTSPTIGTGTSVTALTFATTVLSNGSDITYTRDTTNGDTWTINTTGIYSLTATGSVNNGNSYSFLFWSRNASPTTVEGGLTSTTMLVINGNYYSYQIASNGSFHLQAGDVLRLHVTHGSIFTSQPFNVSLNLQYATTT